MTALNNKPLQFQLNTPAPGYGEYPPPLPPWAYTMRCPRDACFSLTKLNYVLKVPAGAQSSTMTQQSNGELTNQQLNCAVVTERQCGHIHCVTICLRRCTMVGEFLKQKLTHTHTHTHTHSCIWLNPIAATACKISRQKSAHIRLQTEKNSVLHLNLPSILCILMEILWHTITHAKEKRKGLRNFKFSTFTVCFQVTSWHWNSERVKSWLMTDCGQLFALWLVSGERYLTLQWWMNTTHNSKKKTEKKEQPYSMPLPVPHIPPHANTKVNLLLDPSE